MNISLKNSLREKQMSQNGHSKLKQNTPAYKKYKDKENKYSTTRPAQAISFSGSVISAGQKAGEGVIEKQMISLGEKLGKKIVNAKGINNLVDRVYDNEAAFNAVYSLIIAGILKPTLVLAMPGSEEKDKQIVATKNFLQAFIGSFLGYTVGGGFIKKAIDVIKNNIKLFNIDNENKIVTVKQNSSAALEVAQSVLEKEHNGLGQKFARAKEGAKEAQGLSKIGGFIKEFRKKEKYTPEINEIYDKAGELIDNFNKNHKAAFEKNPNFIKMLKTNVLDESRNMKSTYYDSYESFWKNSTGWITAIGKAKISSALLPGVMAFLFAKRNLENARKNNSSSILINNNSSYKNEKTTFENAINRRNKTKNNSSQTFTGGIVEKGIDASASMIEKVSISKPGAKCSEVLAKFKKPSARMADLESGIITAYWLQNTARSKKIEPSQKWGLNIHTALVTVVSSISALLIDTILDGVIDGATNVYAGKLHDIVKETASEHKELLQNTPKDALAGLDDAVRLAINNSCRNLVESGKCDKTSIENTIAELSKTKPIQNLPEGKLILNENLIKNVVNNLEKTEPIKNSIKEKSKNMLNSKKIVKELSGVNLLDQKTTDKAIASLCQKYNKELSKFKSLSVFTFVVRFLVPVLMVPVSGTIKKKVMEFVKKREENKKNKNVETK